MNPPWFGDINPPIPTTESGVLPISTDERIRAPEARSNSRDVVSDALESEITPIMKLNSQLESLELEYQSRVDNIRRETEEERSAIVDRLETEKQILLAELYAQEDLNLMRAKDAFEKKRASVLSGVSSTQSCAICNMNCKYLSASCIECKGYALCFNCLNEKIADACKCSNCRALSSIICPSCQIKKLRDVGWFEFDSCRAGCGFLCPQHSTVLLCQCCGYQSFCNGPKRHCQLHQCSKCGIVICSTCRKNEGCMCSSSFNIFDNTGWRPMSSSSTPPPASSSRDSRWSPSPDSESKNNL